MALSDAEVLDHSKSDNSSKTLSDEQVLEHSKNTNSEGFIASKIGNLTDLSISDAKKAAKNITDIALSRDPSADYEKGLDFSEKVSYLGQDSDKERQALLDVIHPGAKLIKDPGGKNLIKFPDGKLIEPEGSGFWRNLGAEMMAHSPELGAMATGAATGATYGAGAGPYGAAAGGLFGAVAGGVTGKSIEELLKISHGIQRKTGGEMAESLVQAAKEGASAEAGGKVMDKGIKALVSGYPFGMPFLSKVQETSKRMTKRALERGMVPPLSKAIPVATLLSQKQRFVEKVLGSSRDEQNVVAAKKGMADLLKQSGMSNADAGISIDAIVRGDVDIKTLGEKAQKYYTNVVSGLLKKSESLKKEASESLSKKFSDIDKKIANPEIDPAQAISDIRTAKEEFSQQAGKQYGIVDELVGNKPVLSTSPMKQKIKDLFFSGKFPLDDKGNILFPGEGAAALNKYIQDLLKQPDLISFKQGQNIRSQLLSQSYNGELLTTMGEKNLGDLASAADDMFSKAAKGYFKSGGEGNVVKKAAQALSSADKWYADNIIKFRDVDVARLARDAGKSGAVRVEDVAKYIADPRYPSKMNKILSLLQPETRQAVARQTFDKMIDQSKDVLTGKIVPTKLLNEVDKLKKISTNLWGKNQAEQIRIYAKQLAAMDAKVPEDILQGDSSQVANKLRMAAKQHEEAMSMLNNQDTFLSALGKPGFLHDEAFNMMLRPGEEHRTELAMKFFRGTPVEKEIKQAFIQKMLSNLSNPKETWQKIAGIIGNEGGSLNATSFAKELSKYSNKQLDTILGKDLAGDFRRYAEDMDFVMGQSAGDIAAALAAGAAKLHMTLLDPFQWKRYAYYALGELLLSRPGVTKALTLGLKYPEGSPIRVGIENSLKVDLDNFLISHRKDIESENKKSPQ